MVIRTDAKVPVQRKYCCHLYLLVLLSSNDTDSSLLGECINCGYISSQEYCQACILLSKLNQGLPEVTIGDERSGKRHRARKVPEEIAKMSALSINGDKEQSCGSGCSGNSCISGR